MESKSFFVAHIEFNDLQVVCVVCLLGKIDQTQNMLLAQAIAAQSGKLRDWKTSWVQKHEKHGRRCFFNFLFFFFAGFLRILPGFEDGTSILSRIDTGGFHVTCSSAHLQRLQKSQNSAGTAFPKHPHAAFAAQRTKNLREKRQVKKKRDKFCDSMSAFFQELWSKYYSV